MSDNEPSDDMKPGEVRALMRAPRVNYHNSSAVRPNWSWQPARAKKQLEKEQRDRERT